MYKDVKKKLLSVALCICMVIGMVQVVPKVKAAGTEQTKQMRVNYGNVDKTVTVTYTTYMLGESRYNGTKQPPTLTSVIRDDSRENVTNSFELYTSPADPPVNAGTYDVSLRCTDGKYSIVSGAAIDTHTIDQAVLNSYTFTCSNTVSIKDNSGAAPVLTEATLQTEYGATIDLIKLSKELGRPLYTVSNVTNTGMNNVTATVTVADEMKSNFSNADQFNNISVKCSAGYDLLDNNFYEVAFLGKNNEKITQVDYTGAPIALKLGIFDKITGNLFAEMDSSNFNIVSDTGTDTVTDIGDHTIKVTPKSGETGIARVDGKGKTEYFTGCYTGSFKVKGHDPKDLKVYVQNPSGEGTIDLNHASTKPVWKYNNGESVVPEIVSVEDDKGKKYHENSDFTVEEVEGTTGVGRAVIKLKFINTSTYEGDLPLSYNISSALKIGGISFESYPYYPADATDFPLFYTGKVQLPIEKEIQVFAESGLKLELGTHYTVSYSYQDSSGWHELSAEQAKTNANMAKPGPKHVIIIGIDAFQGQRAEKQYTVKEVNISQHRNWFTVLFENDTEVYECNYNGRPQTPKMKVTYKNDYVSEQVVTDDFEVSYANHESAGTATVTLEAKSSSGFIGSLQAQFTINHLKLKDAVCVDDKDNETNQYSYTGAPIKPRLKIGDYELEEGKDYEIKSYTNATDTSVLSGAPTAPGSYIMSISEGQNTNNVRGTHEVHYTIVFRDTSTAGFRLERDSYDWEGDATEPEIKYDTSLHLVEGTDYEVEYSNNDVPTKDGSLATAVISPKGSNLTGSPVRLTFTINRRSIDNSYITVDPKIAGNPGNYAVTLNVRDEGEKVKNHNLVEGTDYKVVNITYVTKNQFRNVTCAALNALPYAGEYEVTLEGTENYKDTKTITVCCGTDITGAEIAVNQWETFEYNGAEQFPEITVIIPGEPEETIRRNQSQSDADSEIKPIFTRLGGDHRGREGIDAGEVTVQAQGNPEKGYYGTTTSSAKYTIKPKEISDVYKINFPDATLNTNGKPSFPFTNKEIHPKLEILKKDSAGSTYDEKLVPGRDYEIKYGYNDQDTCIDQGPHGVRIIGKGNFVGELDSEFYIEAKGLNDSEITSRFVFGDDTFYTYADEAWPTLELRLSGNLLKENVDYAVDVRSESRKTGSTWKDTYVYYITGMGNFDKQKREESWEIPLTTLRVKDPKNPQPGETYISAWDYDELMVEAGTQAAQPKKFTLSYVKKDGSLRTLTEGTDFVVKSSDMKDRPGEDSQITIEGINGCTGEKTYKVPLFTDIGKAEFSKDKDGNKTGKLFDGASVSTKMLEDAIKAGTLSDLVNFDPLRNEPGKSRIDSDCYTVTLSCGNTPTIGSVIVTVAGNKEKYYAGSQIFTITVTGSLEGNVSRVVIGDNNAVPWKGEPVTPQNVAVTVWSSDNKPLKGGYIEGDQYPADYDYIVTFKDNYGVGLATAIITGVNKYSGKLEQPFKITYYMDQLTIEIINEEGEWVKYTGGASYLYQIDTVLNCPPIRLRYPTASGSAIVDDKCYSLTYSGYERAGNAKVFIGEPESDDYKGILLRPGRTVDYQLRKIDLKDVTIVIENPDQIYTGLEKTAKDLGLKLIYNGHELGDADYTLVFRNATNTDKVDGNVKATVAIGGKGNFTGGVTEEFSILPLPLSNTDFINATAEKIIYTGRQETPRITISQVLGALRTLREGDDYEIVGYTDETMSTRRETPFTEIGTYYVVVRGLRNYESTTEPYCYIQYEIVKREMDDGLEMTFVSSDSCPVINGEPQCIYNGKRHEPNVYVTFNGVELRGPSQTNPQYDLRYEDNLNAGPATVTVTGTGSFDGEKTMTFTIAPKDITYEDIEYRDSKGNIFADEQEFKWENNNTPVHPEIIVYDKSLQTQLVNGESMDYSINYQDDSDGTQTNAGEVLMTIVGQNNYIGSKQFTYFIGEDISKSYVLVNGQRSYSTAYNGLVQAPREEDISVVWNSDISDKDENGEKRYKIAYYYYGDEVVTGRFDLTHRVGRDQLTEAGTYYVAVVGEPTKGTYAKSDASNSCMYTITPRNIGPSYILVSGYEGAYYYTGQAIEPKGLTVEDTDLPVSNAGNDPQRRSVKLINGKDYTVSYANNISAGKASIIVTGKGNYGGTRTAYFNILSSDADGNNTWNGSSEGTGSISNGTTTISASDIILGYDNSTYDCMMYNGYERIPTISINGINANEFTVTASNNIRPGVATLTITGRGNNYTGTILKNFNIKADLSRYGRIASIEDQVYTGYQITPQVTLTCGGNLLNQGSDYTVTYMNNTGIGRATVTATATNDSYYIGSATGSFNISNTAGGMEITGYASSYTYTGYAITPDVAVTMNGRLLNRGTDYVVSYYNNVNVGTATMTVTGMGSFSGTKTINYTIEAKNIENCLTTTVTNYKYTGNTYTPSVTVTDSSTGKTLVAGTDYTIVYSNNTNPGTASITVTALSKNYTGSKVIPFKITSAAVSGLRVSSIKNSSLKLSWSSQDYADGYQICNSKNRVIATTSKNSYTVKGLNSCTTYKYKVRSYVENTDGSRSYGSFSTAVSAKTRLNTPKLKAVSTSKGKVTLTWTKVSKATGYEIYYSTKKNGLYTRLKTISKSSSRKYVDSGLASGEKYYYTIRAYRTTNGVKTYSSYNTIKAVRVK